uniref:Uncharacterized protein n=1 Tax=Arundo donax TaxID=35708 RepID=A0A0A9GVH1_ARUDO
MLLSNLSSSEGLSGLVVNPAHTIRE